MDQKTSIFHYSKNYGSLTRETRFKVAINTADPTCPFGDRSYITRVQRVIAISLSRDGFLCLPTSFLYQSGSDCRLLQCCPIWQYIADLDNTKSKTIPQCITIIQIIHFLFFSFHIIIKIFGYISATAIHYHFRDKMK